MLKEKINKFKNSKKEDIEHVLLEYGLVTSEKVFDQRKKRKGDKK